MSANFVRWSEVTAVFGGRFDPPHLGHREAVRGLFQIPGVQRVLVIPSASPPHKPSRASAQDRAAMADLNFKATPYDAYPSEVVIDLRELERSRQRPELPSYSYDTLQELKPLYSSLAFVVGTDHISQLHTWHRFPDILGLCHWIVLDRKNTGKDTDLKAFSTVRQTLREWQGSGLLRSTPSGSPPGSGGECWQVRGPKGSAGANSLKSLILLVPTQAPAVSSTEIREAISRTGQAPAGALLPEVCAYLKDRRIYGIKQP